MEPNQENIFKKYKKTIVRLPIYVFIALAMGIVIGATLNSSENSPINNYLKFRQIIGLIDREYVDSVNTDELVDHAIEKMLEKLDPHTAYIPAKDRMLANTALESNFDGIGIQFEIIKDTLYVVSPISGGPSEKVGILTGDKIIEIDGKNIAGIGLTTEQVFEKLRGQKGTKVNLKIKRGRSNTFIDFVVTRDKIPTYSVDSYYMIDDKSGYIKVSRFAENTYEEFRDALMKLQAQGMQQLMIDLRYNSGGYLDVAIQMVDELLADGKLIVYTDGKVPQYDSKAYAVRKGIFEKGPIIVLINEGSASASEILSGALQDNDRGLIVGRRSFGKGLVQRPFVLEDNSEIRLTISRYYTPSGRSIQRDYTDGAEAYEDDFVKRFQSGELYSADSIKFDKNQTYKTVRGRTVYGGGGIMPDYFIPADTSFNYTYYNEHGTIVRAYGMELYNHIKKDLKKMPFEQFRDNYKIPAYCMQEIKKRAEIEGIKYNEQKFKDAIPHFEEQLKIIICRSQYGINESFQLINAADKLYIQAISLFEKAKDVENGKLD